MPSVGNLVKKIEYNTKINEIENKITAHNHDKYITTSEFTKLTSQKLCFKTKQASLARKSDIANSMIIN